MEFERLVADFAEAAGLELSVDSEGTVWCDADGVPVTLQHRGDARKDELMGAVGDEFDRNEFVAQGHGRKVVEGLYTILVGVDGRKDGE